MTETRRLAVQNVKTKEHCMTTANTLQGDPDCVVTAGDPATEGPVSDEALKGLLASNPTAGIEVLLRMDSMPESPERPFGRRERFLSDAICDTSLPRSVRARLLDGIVYDGDFLSFPMDDVKGDVPVGLLDAPAVRKWYCARKKPGYRDIRCSDRHFFGQECKFEPRTPIDNQIEAAIAADSTAQFMLGIGLAGYGMAPQYLQAVLKRHSFHILEYLTENAEGEADLLDPRTMLFYVCANWGANYVVKWLLRSEKRHRGLAKTCVDALGRNLLWYRRYFDRSRRWGTEKKNNVVETLLRLGCDPDAETAWGLSWRDMAGLPSPMSDERRLYDVFINGQRLKAGKLKLDGGCFIPFFPGWKAVNEIKIVMRGSGRTMTWKPDVKFYFSQDAPFTFGPREFAITWHSKEVYKLGRDGLFHKEKPE